MADSVPLYRMPEPPKMPDAEDPRWLFVGSGRRELWDFVAPPAVSPWKPEVESPESREYAGAGR
jgi:hypothetical protein